MTEEINFIIDTAKESMEHSIAHLEKEFLNIRAGKATPQMLGGVFVEYYGSMTPLSQVAINLDAVVAVLAKYANVSLAIGGHTDNTGAEKLNSKLSVNRANVVAKYLAKKGVDAKRITTSGFGFANPTADNKTKDGRAQNRRAELTAVYN